MPNAKKQKYKVVFSFEYKDETEEYENELETWGIEQAIFKTLREARKTVLKGKRITNLQINCIKI